MTREQKKQITEMRKQNLGYAYIAKEPDISLSKVKAYIAKELDISLNTVKAFRRRNDLIAQIVEGFNQDFELGSPSISSSFLTFCF